MLFDSELHESSWFDGDPFDVCIVGTGPAGMSLALKLAEKGWKIGLFEGGGLEPTQQSSDVYRGKNTGIDYFPLDATRLRYFGGTSGHWNGMCRPLEDFDFEAAPHSPYGGWPIRKTDLDPFAPQAARILDLGPAEKTHDLFGGKNASLVPFQFQWSKPTRFGQKYRRALSTDPSIRVFLNANLVDLDLGNGNRHVSKAIFRSYRKSEPFSVEARFFAICLGGLENPRFLLNANRQLPGGIGNENGMVGRFFCDHMIFRLGQVFLDPSVQAGASRIFFHPTREFMVANRINNFGLRLQGEEAHKPDTAFESAIRRSICDFPLIHRVADEIRGVDMTCFDANLSVIAATALNPDSRVLLGDELDHFGKRRIRLDWRLTDIDKRTLRLAALELGKQLAVHNVGRLKVEDWVLDPRLVFPTTAQDEVGGNHHMCSTRMSDDPRLGVVDRDCRVHSIENLYLGGSSVFATPGYCNPTFTIVQLALRLADHLNAKLKSARA